MVVKKAATRAAAAIVVVVRARMVAVRVVVAVRAAAARVVVARARMEVLRVVMVRATAARVVVAKARVAGEMGDRRNRSNPRPNCHYLSLIQPHSAHVVQSAIRRRGRHLPSLHHRSSQCCQAAPPQPLPYTRSAARRTACRPTLLRGGGRYRMYGRAARDAFSAMLFLQTPPARSPHLSNHARLSFQATPHPSPASNLGRERLRPRIPPSLSSPCT